MADVNIIINQLRPYKGQYKSIRKRQSIQDLMDDILDKHKKEEPEADKIAKLFWRGSARATGQYLFDFCKENLIYKEELTENQSVKALGAILIEKKVDCKNYSLFIVSICCALRRMGYPIAAKYRFAIYTDKPDAKGVRSGHVFAVIMDNGREIWCDPVVDSFDQRTPKYIKHTDKIPPMSGVGRLGEVWDVTGLRNDTTLSGMANDVTMGRAHNNAYNDFMNAPLDAIPPVAVISLYKHLFGRHKRHGKHSLNRHDQAMLARLHHRFGMVEAAHRAAGTEHLLNEAVQNAPASLPGRGSGSGSSGSSGSSSGSGAGRTVTGLTVSRDENGTLMERTVNGIGNGITLGWVDEYLSRDSVLGKAKKPHKKHHGLHIRIHPGEILKKYNPALVTARNAFLVLMKADVFHIGARIWGKAQHDPAFKSKIDHFWKNLGGNTNKLHTALTQGTHVWNAHHPAHKISGMANDETLGVAGVDDAGYVAAIAAATPIIIKITDLLKKAGIPVPGKGDLDKANQKMIKQHNEGDPDEDGTITHPDGTQTTVTTDDAGNKVLTMNHKGDQGGDDDDDEETNTKTKTKTTTKEEEEEPDGDEEEVTTKTKTKEIVKQDNEHGIAKYWDEFKGFVVEHKTWFIVGGIALVSLFVVPKIYHAVATPHKKGRR